MVIMSKSLFKYDNGLEIFNITGRGIVISFPYTSKEDNGIQPSFKQHIGDKWIFEFNNTDLSNKIVEVKGIEIANSFIQPYSPYGLCFGGQFNEDEKKLMKLGQVSFHKIENNNERV